MDKIDLKTKNLIARINGTIGYILCLFSPILAIVAFGLGIFFSINKEKDRDLKMNLLFNIVGLISGIILFILVLI